MIVHPPLIYDHGANAVIESRPPVCEYDQAICVDLTDNWGGNFLNGKYLLANDSSTMQALQDSTAASSARPAWICEECNSNAGAVIFLSEEYQKWVITVNPYTIGGSFGYLTYNSNYTPIGSGLPCSPSDSIWTQYSGI